MVLLVVAIDRFDCRHFHKHGTCISVLHDSNSAVMKPHMLVSCIFDALHYAGENEVPGLAQAS